MKLLFLQKRPPRYLRGRFSIIIVSRFAANIFRKPLLITYDKKHIGSYHTSP